MVIDRRAILGLGREVLILAAAGGILGAGLQVVKHVTSNEAEKPSASQAARTTAVPRALDIGAHVSVRGVEFPSSVRASVLVISRGDCGFCRDNLAFHKRLFSMASRDLAVYAVVQDAKKEQQYLAQLGAAGGQVLTWADLGFGVRGTPTIVLLAQAGTVAGIWLGRLDTDAENLLVQTILEECTDVAGSGSAWVTGPGQSVSGSAHAVSGMNVRLVDVRERERFRQRHRLGAANVPLSEFPLRSRYEFDPGSSYVVDCGVIDMELCRLAVRRFESMGIMNVSAFDAGRIVGKCEFTAVVE